MVNEEGQRGNIHTTSFFFKKIAYFFTHSNMPKSKRKSPVSTPQCKAKRQKHATSDVPPIPVSCTDESMRKCIEHVNMCVTRVNMLLKHTQFIQSKLYELAMITNREIKKISFEIHNLQMTTKICQEDAYRLCPELDDILTVPQTPVDFAEPDGYMAEDMLVKCVGDFADSLYPSVQNDKKE